MHYSDWEQRQMDQQFNAQMDAEDAARRSRYYVDINVGTGVGKVIDAKGGRDKVLFEGTVREAHAYAQDIVAH